MRKLLSILLSVLMICALATPTFAATTVTTEADLQTALTNGGEVVLGADIVATSKLTVPAGSTVTLDLNGKTLSMEDSSTTTSMLVLNQGNLTIKDSSGSAGKISFKATNPDTASVPGYASNTIRNEGVLTVESGTIENTSAAGSACYAIDNYAGSTCTINGGVITARSTVVRIFNWTNGEENKAVLNVNGGEIRSEVGYAINVNSGNSPYVELNITGGEISTSANPYNLAVYVVNKGSAENNKINVTGGSFEGDFALNGVTGETITEEKLSISGGSFEGLVMYGEPSFDFISGGTFSVDVTDYVVEGMEQDENGKVVPIEPEQEEPTTPTITCAGSDDKNCDGVVTCDEVHGEGWDWNNTTKACEFFGTVKPNVYIVDTATK